VRRLAGVGPTLGSLRRPTGAQMGGWVSRFLQNQGLLLVILVFGIVMSQLSDVFLTRQNLINVLYQSTILGVLAIGMTFVILTAGIDLSVGSTAAVASVLSIGVVVDQGWPTAVGILVALGAGVGIGLVNGLAVTKIGITPLIATLATLSAGTGLAFAYTDGANKTPVPDIYRDVGRAEILGFPAMIPFTLVLALIAHIVLTRTSFGRAIYAVGGNALAARLAGVRTDRVITAVYVICGLTAATAGLMLTARLASGSPRAGQGIELTVIAAVVIGGTSLFGGQGNILGTLLGVLLITMVTNAINLLGVPSAYDSLVTGGVIFVAAAVDVYRTRYTERVMARRARGGRTSGEPPPDPGDVASAAAPPQADHTEPR
jgi:ribose transport system permease protein